MVGECLALPFRSRFLFGSPGNYPLQTKTPVVENFVCDVSVLVKQLVNAVLRFLSTELYVVSMRSLSKSTCPGRACSPVAGNLVSEEADPVGRGSQGSHGDLATTELLQPVQGLSGNN